MGKQLLSYSTCTGYTMGKQSPPHLGPEDALLLDVRFLALAVFFRARAPLLLPLALSLGVVVSS
jgi:hypothetical protein